MIEVDKARRANWAHLAAKACASLEEAYRSFASISDATNAMRFDVRHYPDIEHLLESVPDPEQIGQTILQLTASLREGSSSSPIFADQFDERFDEFYRWCGKSDNELLEMRKTLSQ